MAIKNIISYESHIGISTIIYTKKKFQNSNVGFME